MVNRLIPVLLLGTLLALPAQARIEAELDRNRIAPGEAVQLTLTLENNDAEPELDDLQANFEILQRRKVSKTRIINGKSSRQRQRIVLLAPKQTGTILIPPIRAGHEQSQALRLEVQSSPTAQANKDAFLEVLLSSRQAYVRAELVVTIRAWYRGQVEGNLTSPAIDGALVEQLGEQQTGTQVRDGLRYTVVERRYLVFPQQPGTMEIPSLALSGTQSLGGRSSILNPYGPGGGRRIHVRSAVQQVEVLPVPADWPQGEPWLPARDLQLTEHWSQDLQQLATGQAVTRSIRLRADGQSASALPPLPLQWPAGVKIYPDQPQLDQQLAANGVAGSRTESVALIPLQSGTLHFPALKLYWWDTGTDRLRTASIPARTGAISPTNPGTASPAAPALPPQASSTPQPQAITQTDAGSWPWIAAACLLGWILTVLAWVASHRRTEPVTRRIADAGPSLQQLREACRNNDPLAARRALSTWATEQSDTPASGVQQLAQHRGDSVLERAVEELDQALYGKGDGSAWNGSALWQAVKSAAKHPPDNNSSQNSQDLPSLYPS